MSWSFFRMILFVLYEVFKVHPRYQFSKTFPAVLAVSANPYKKFFLYRFTNQLFLKIRQPPIFPGRLQPSIVGRVSLNHRVRDGYGCFPDAHRHRKYEYFAILCFVLFVPLDSDCFTLKLRSLLSRIARSCPLSRYSVSFRVQHARLIHPSSLRIW